MKLSSVVLTAVLGLAAPAAAVAENPPPDANLFQTVAGSWGWADLEASNCTNNPHTIAFLNNNRTMTITSTKPYKSSTGAMTNVATYDVLYAEGNKITAFIQRESRRTDAGDRVVWVLILADKNAYSWRRTDWAADAHTKKIIRCHP